MTRALNSARILAASRAVNGTSSTRAPTILAIKVESGQQKYSEKKKETKKTQKQKKNVPVFKENYQFQNECDCRLENGLLKRGKIKCKKTKAEHNF